MLADLLALQDVRWKTAAAAADVLQQSPAQAESEAM